MTKIKVFAVAAMLAIGALVPASAQAGWAW